MLKVESRDSEYDTDARGNLLYWNCVTGEYPILDPAQLITDPHMVVGKVGQQNILPNHLTFKRADLESSKITDKEGNFVGTVPPGISGILFFGVFHSNFEGAKDRIARELGKDLHTKSRLHIAQVGDIMEAGWRVFFAPLIDGKYEKSHPLHVIMSPNSLLYSQPLVIDATEQEKVALAQTFVRWTY